MPFRFVPIGSNSSLEQALAVINANFAQLDSEAVTKTFKQPGGNAIIEGKLPYEGGYGLLFYDSNGVARILIGVDPDGGMGLYVSKPGEDVIEAFS